jgi:hypothetical protein
VTDLVRSGDWCIGGDRVWLAPEVQFNIPDRLHWDSGGAYVLPKAVDPGEYRLGNPGDGAVSLEQTVSLQLHNLASGTKKVRVCRTVRAARDPLRSFTAYAEVSGSAGLLLPWTIEETTDDIIDRTLNINVKGILYAIRAATPWRYRQ